MKLFYQKLERELMAKEGPPTVEQLNEHMGALIRQEYHVRIHRATGESPEEQFFAYPDRYRRFVSQNTLMMTFFPCTKSKVSKTGIIRTNKLENLVTHPQLFGKWVEVRSDCNDIPCPRLVPG